MRIWAHQGGAEEGPSNTVEAVRRALAGGTDAVEIDVHRTRDDRLVVCHDPDLGRTTEREGAIRALSLAEVRDRDAAHWWVPGHVVRHDRPAGDYPLRWRGAPTGDQAERVVVPTIEEVEAVLPAGMPLTIELKGEGTEPLLAEHLATEVRNGSTRPVTVVSFWGGRVRRFARLLDEQLDGTSWGPIGTAPGTGFQVWMWLCSRVGIAARPRLKGAARLQSPLRAPGRLHRIVLTDRRMVDAAHRRGLEVDVWTVDEPRDIDRLLATGVDGVMTDRPAEMVRARDRRDAT